MELDSSGSVEPCESPNSSQSLTEDGSSEVAVVVASAGVLSLRSSCERMRTNGRECTVVRMNNNIIVIVIVIRWPEQLGFRRVSISD